jgi:hypothetical protein
MTAKKTKATYEYKDAIHVPFPALDKRPIELLSVREAYGPDLRRGVHDRRRHGILSHWERWKLCDLVTAWTKMWGASFLDYSTWSACIYKRCLFLD